jgi:hypothetical protein
MDQEQSQRQRIGVSASPRWGRQGGGRRANAPGAMWGSGQEFAVYTEKIDTVGFTDTGYQRSLPLHESGEYTFLNATLLARNNGFHA